jgi:hypothetical protein
MEARVINGTEIVVLSGSTRFTNEMLMLTWDFAKKGVLALGWCVLPTNYQFDGSEIDHHLPEKEGLVGILDQIHLRKIDLADRMYVVNVGGYIGEATAKEISYAMGKGIPVHYLEPLK